MTDEHRQVKRADGHLVVYVVWPIAAGLGLATVAGVSTLGILWLATGDLQTAARIAGYTWFATSGLVTLGLGWYAAREWRGPAQKERLETTRQTVIEVAAPEQPPRFIPMHTGRKLTEPVPRLPQTSRERGLVAAAIGTLASGLTRRARIATVEHQVAQLGPTAPAWVEECYRVLCASWPDKLTRRDWQRLFPDGGTSLWKKWINGDGSGRRGGRGVFATWGVIEKGANGRSWVYSQPLDVILSLDADLKTYADAMSGLRVKAGTEPNPTGDRTESRGV